MRLHYFLIFLLITVFLYHSSANPQPQPYPDGSIGFTKEVIKEGSGPKPARGQSVTVHCTGFGKNGDLSLKFWSTKDPGQEPFTFKLGIGKVIKGWDEGVAGMVRD
jgi:FKBP-type peptidyl-prolyl cis-trans isomerase